MSKDFFGHSVYFLTETPGERRLNPVTTAAGIFQPLRPTDTSPIFCMAKHRGGGRGHISYFYNQTSFYTTR